MQEALFQALWQHSLYNAANLRTTAGEPLTVVHPGILNRHAGPDFSAARIRLGNLTLVGAVELHLRSSDWRRHRHSEDPAYSNIILHVVYEDDLPGAAPQVPVLVLGEAQLPQPVIRQYAHLVQQEAEIPCAAQHHQVSQIVKESWLTRVLAERWESRQSDWLSRLENLRGDWAALLYERLAGGFGFKVNSEAFVQLAQATPPAILFRHSQNLKSLEALLFGQAGLLPEHPADDYSQGLVTEYRFLKNKYGLQPMSGPPWKFMRLRPPNFPTIRISQFAALIHKWGSELPRLAELAGTEALEEALQVAASPYWEAHFQFGTAAKDCGPRRVGRASAENLVLNVLAPYRFFKAAHTGGNREEAVELLYALPAEVNHITRQYTAIGWKPRNAADSQALLELFKGYCTPRRCLHCAVGLRLLRAAGVE